ncbi:MAG: HAMP domain-containing sensor histidine kinase [Muribaculaceae bacterium]|nr:HAMP domain-containing sensor histidine kinase [Muribaculaceae bacterium]
MRHLFLFLILAVFSASAATEGRQATLDSLNHQLVYVNTSKDSVKILYDIFDLHPSPSDRCRYARMILNTAERAKDLPAQLDMLRQLDVALGNDMRSASQLHRLDSVRLLANRFPESDQVNDTKLFIDLFNMMRRVRLSDEASRQKQMAALIAKADKKKITAGNWYEQALDLYTVCVYLGMEGTPNLLPEYLKKMENKLKEKKGLDDSVWSLFYMTSAILYSDAGCREKAVEADKSLLGVIARFEKEYAASGRRFRNFDRQKYVIYRRMLSNYKMLSPEESELYYKEAMKIAARNPEIAADMQASPRVEAYHAMATKDYAKAIQLIKASISPASRNNPLKYRNKLEMLIEAARATGDQATLLHALDEHHNVEEQLKNERRQDLYKELQKKYDTNELRAENAELELEKRDSLLASNRQTIVIISIAFAIVLILICVLFYYYRRARALSNHLSAAVGRLEEERDTLNRIQTQLISARDRAEAANKAKDEFLHSMSHEIRTPLNAIMGFSRLMVKKVPETVMPKMKSFSHQISYNTELLEVLINDILYLSAVDKHTPSPSVEPTSASTMLSLAAQWVAHKVKPGVYVDCRMPNPDIKLRTDRSDVEEILMKLLSNAAKFTEKGSITLECIENKADDTASFIITDTGSGIAPGYEEEIFDRFVKLDTFKQGTGLGLYICRRLAESLRGRVYVDKGYRKGARFILTIPKEIPSAE